MDLQNNKRQKPSVENYSYISTLPIDILIEIFSFNNLHGRFRAISLVCKRWRIAALRSITSLYCNTPGPSPNLVLPLLPSLTEFDCSYSSFTSSSTTTPTTILPHHLTKLSCFSFESDNSISPPFPPLRSLSVSKFSGPLFISLLREIKTSLTSLSLSTYKMPKSVESFLSTNAFFPSLLSLQLDLNKAYNMPDNSKSIINFIKRHSSQILSLKLSGNNESWIDLSSISFSCLCSLDISVYHLNHNHISKLLRNLPNLIDLKISHSDVVYNIPKHLLSSLVELEPLSLQSSQQQNFLDELPRLSSIIAPSIRHFKDFISSKMYTRITTLLLHSHKIWEKKDYDVNIISMFTNIRVLHLDQSIADPVPATLANVSFPYLKTLYIQWGWEDAFHTMLFFIRSSPRLKKIDVFLSAMEKSTKDDQFRTLRQFLREAELSGLEEILINYRSVVHIDTEEFENEYKWLKVSLIIADDPEGEYSEEEEEKGEEKKSNQ